MACKEERVDAIQEELAHVRQKIQELQEIQSALESQLHCILEDCNSEDEIQFVSQKEPPRPLARPSKSSQVFIDYTSKFQPPKSSQEKPNTNTPWSWSKALHDTMKKVWGIDKFRLNQEAACNAVLSNRDVLVIMPTGGGKSLIYQLPALLSEGITLVISPLVALMVDQVIHLKEAGVPAEMLNGSTTRQDASLITQRLLHSTSDLTEKISTKKGKQRASHGDLTPIKLCYVTPEKIAKSKSFLSTLQKMYSSNRLVRIIIDEAHCCSSMGHDFRPDYKQLSILRTLFPNTPIVALTATCPPNVMVDVLKILKLGPISNSNKAKLTGVVLLTSPLNRPNLHYQVLSKPASNADLIAQIVSWIEKNHPSSQGIIYALSQKDTATVAQGILTLSERRITTGIYHASLSDSQKHQIHSAWREGSIKVICATTAFGMGIDAPHVRFVIHHTLPKSMEGYYQESGRAGRDGLDSDCLLFWKTNDLMRLSGMVASEVDGIRKLYSMAKYATELERCRSILFAEYFNTSHSASYQPETLAFSQQPCGQCDNCKRDPSQIQREDVTLEACKICRVVSYIHKMNSRVTLVQLGDLMRGIGSPMSTIIKNRQSEDDLRDDHHDVPSEIFTLDSIGGKLVIKKEQVENLILHLVLRGYLEEQFVATAYTVNNYIKLGSKSRELLSHQGEIIKSDHNKKISIPSHLKITIPSVTTITSKSHTSITTSTVNPKIKNSRKKQKLDPPDHNCSTEPVEYPKRKRGVKSNVIIMSEDEEEEEER